MLLFQSSNYLEFSQIADMRFLVFTEMDLLDNGRLMEFQCDELWR